MGYFSDLREFIEELERRGKLQRIKRRVNKDTELMPLFRLQFRGLAEENRKAFLFENVTDAKGRRYDMKVMPGSYGASREIFALGMGCERPEEVYEKWRHACTHPIEPVLVNSGPVQEEVHMGVELTSLGLDELPSPVEEPGFSGTIRTTMDLVFGDGRAAERAVKRLNSVHARVRGDVDDIEARRVAWAYRALDPELLLWVQATLIVTSVRAFQRWVGPLSAGEREQFWQEARAVGVRLGIPLSLSPAGWPALEAYWARMLADDGPVYVTPTARRLSRLIVRPPLPFVPGPLVDLAALPGLALLPPRLRAEFGIPWDARRAALARLETYALSCWTRVVPTPLRSMPQALAADRRVRSGGRSAPRSTSASENRKDQPEPTSGAALPG